MSAEDPNIEKVESVVQQPAAPKERKSRFRLIATWVSIFLWVTSIVASFAIPPKSPVIWLPDALLLLGFIPLMVSFSFSWTWILFGLSNLSIGFFLLVVNYLPDQFPPDVVKAKHHLAEYHEPFTWMAIGSLCAIYGFGRFLYNLVMWIKLKKRGSPSS